MAPAQLPKKKQLWWAELQKKIKEKEMMKPVVIQLICLFARHIYAKYFAIK